MSDVTAAVLKERGLLRVSGSDAPHFLNGLVTSEMETLEDGAARLAALLTPQGKILFDFLLLNTKNGFILDCQAAQVPDMLKRLGLYRLRSRVEIEDLSALHTVIAVWGGTPQAVPDVPAYADPRHPRMGWRMIVGAGDTGDALAALGTPDAGPAAYHAHRVALGIPEGGADYASGEVFPHEACLDQLGGVSFSKGCFVGQEVVSRMEHRGTARSRFLPFSAEGGAPKSGAEISAGGKALGTVGSVSGNTGIALVRLDRLESALADGSGAEAGGARLTFAQPDWARFSVPRARAS